MRPASRANMFIWQIVVKSRNSRRRVIVAWLEPKLGMYRSFGVFPGRRLYYTARGMERAWNVHQRLLCKWQGLLTPPATHNASGLSNSNPDPLLL